MKLPVLCVGVYGRKGVPEIAELFCASSNDGDELLLLRPTSVFNDFITNKPPIPPIVRMRAERPMPSPPLPLPPDEVFIARLVSRLGDRGSAGTFFNFPLTITPLRGTGNTICWDVLGGQAQSRTYDSEIQ